MLRYVFIFVHRLFYVRQHKNGQCREDDKRKDIRICIVYGIAIENAQLVAHVVMA